MKISKWIFLIIPGLLIFGPVTFAKTKASKPSDNIELKSKRAKISYSIGVDIGENLKSQEMDIDLDVMLAAIKDVLSNKKKRMTDDEIMDTLLELRKEVMEKMRKKRNKLIKENLAKGEEFLAENKKNQDVVTLSSGLQYKVLTQGEGQIPTENDTVSVHYIGKLIDGSEFDNSYVRGEPATFPVTGVIEGWKEALQIMKVGSKWELFIPAGLAYGERGAGSMIGPNETLIFTVELLSIEKVKE